ncbi:MAG: hypothetical protein ACTSRA_07620 [Promethearchaeota archaeon]
MFLVSSRGFSGACISHPALAPPVRLSRTGHFSRLLVSGMFSRVSCHHRVIDALFLADDRTDRNIEKVLDQITKYLLLLLVTGLKYQLVY